MTLSRADLLILIFIPKWISPPFNFIVTPDSREDKEGGDSYKNKRTDPGQKRRTAGEKLETRFGHTSVTITKDMITLAIQPTQKEDNA